MRRANKSENDKKLRKVFPFLLILLVLLILLGSYLLIRVQKLNTAFSPSSDKFQGMNFQDVSMWEDTIKSNGLKKTAEMFYEGNMKADLGIQHSNAHAFGKSLYLSAGLNGISYCDSNFNFGCYHSFLGTAIHEEGLGVVNILNQKCIDNLKEQSLGCQHGIGHGIAAHIGYSYKELVDSLKICETLPFNDPIGGCYGGVFMEFNFQTMLDTEGVVRSWDESKPLYPCDNLPLKFREPCYYWQAQWWATVIEGDINNKYKKIGEYCRSLGSEENTQCYIGAGNIAGEFSLYNPAETIGLCRSIARGMDEELLCRIGAAGSYLSQTQTMELAPRLCDGLSTSLKNRCLRDSNVPI